MRRLILIALILCSSALYADVATIPANISLRGLADWAILAGNIGSGSGSLPAVATAGALFIDISTATMPVPYRSDGSSWVPLVAVGRLDVASATWTFPYEYNVSSWTLTISGGIVTSITTP